jgi:hypothetical protein
LGHKVKGQGHYYLKIESSFRGISKVPLCPQYSNFMGLFPYKVENPIDFGVTRLKVKVIIYNLSINQPTAVKFYRMNSLFPFLTNASSLLKKKTLSGI